MKKKLLFALSIFLLSCQKDNVPNTIDNVKSDSKLVEKKTFGVKWLLRNYIPIGNVELVENTCPTSSQLNLPSVPSYNFPNCFSDENYDRTILYDSYASDNCGSYETAVMCRETKIIKDEGGGGDPDLVNTSGTISNKIKLLPIYSPANQDDKFDDPLIGVSNLTTGNLTIESSSGEIMSSISVEGTNVYYWNGRKGDGNIFAGNPQPPDEVDNDEFADDGKYKVKINGAVIQGDDYNLEK